MNAPRILIAAGGTGGHLYPAIAVAEEMKKLNGRTRIAFVGTRHRIEARVVPKEGYEFFAIPSPMLKKNIVSIVTFPFRFFAALLGSRTIVKNFSPHALFCAGAYLSVPVAMAASWRNVPVVLNETNALPGRANKFLARYANEIFLSFDAACGAFIDKKKLHVVGTPIRARFDRLPSQAEARKFFGLDEDRPTVFIVGGSLGARSINRAMKKVITRFIEDGLQILWQTGPHADEYKDEHWTHVRVVPFIERMDMAYAAADLIVARAGSSTIAELASVGKPAILVPYPFAAGNHQEENARAVAERGAATVMKDNELDEKLFHSVTTLMGDGNTRLAMSDAMKTLGGTNAARVIAEKILTYVH